MAEPQPSPEDNEPKKETVRISLPPRVAGGGEVKRETVRITLPPKPGLGTPGVPSASAGAATLPGGSIPQQGVVTPRVSMPPPPKPGPLPPPKAGPPIMKPPPAVASPGAMPKPVPPPGSKPAAAMSGAPPVVSKPASPKKETARIQLPPEPKAMPKATVKMEQTQPMPQGPRGAITQTQAAPTAGGGGDALGLPLSLVAFLASAAAFAVQLLAFLGGE